MRILILLPLLLSGCMSLNQTVVNLVDSLNSRNASSCIVWSGYANGLGYASSRVNAITTTGSANIDKCKEILAGQLF